MGKDSRAITNKFMDAELKRLGITVDDLIKGEKNMRPNPVHIRIPKAKLNKMSKQELLALMKKRNKSA